MRKSIYKYIFIIILAVFLTGLMELFNLRFQKGDIYPAYSSLRTDPLGSKVLFRSLSYFKNLSVRRNYQSFERLEGNPDSILLYFGAGSKDFQLREKGFFQSLDQYVIQGGRVVISFLPSQQTSAQVKAIPEKKEKKSESPNHDQDEKDRNFDSMEKHWGIVLTYENLIFKKNGEFVAKKFFLTQKPFNNFQKQLPLSIPWHSTMSFKYSNDSWHTLYTFNEKPVMVEKNLGRGSIVLMTDSFFFSNEALLKDRQVPLLSTLFQGRKEIIFDEYHLGVISQHGIIDLIVQYRLHFFLLSLFCVFVLLVWKNSSLAFQDQQNNATVQLIETKKDYFEGLSSLLRKNILIKNILAVCVEEWYQGRAIKSDQEIKIYIDDIVSSENKDPVRGYQLIYKKLTERKRYE
ncbi:MAG: DUF4350 domain-containing protein [Candidatus Omnitrophica bacterium]|nr:DUF4350 domain-containing protein [Candidatus Omnitrophota bacterium]